MEHPNRPKGRDKHITEGGNGVHKRGEGLHMGGPVGKSDGYTEKGVGTDREVSGRSIGSGSGSLLGSLILNMIFSGRMTKRKMLLLVVLIVLFLALGGGKLLSGFGTDNYGVSSENTIFGSGQGTAMDSSWLGGTSGSTSGAGKKGKLNLEVAAGSREKRTVIRGGGTDQVTLMVYMCGTDLESRSGMATSDLQEMAAADISGKVNAIVYTGGCAGWKNNVVSNDKNQIYQVTSGGVKCLVKDAGNKSMTSPETLTEFIQWCTKNYPANRNELILWDHGGGSLSGYGYDEKYKSSGSMTLAGIDQALKNAGTAFDFIGFDACLMATMETGLMLSRYADYMIAFEETEPGVGWYYTNWLTTLSENPSVSTPELGKQIVDDFVETCASRCRGQKTTLSVVDLAELETTAPQPFAEFSKSASALIQKDKYQILSNARSQTREFAQSSGIDQIDLIHFAENVDTKEGSELAEVLKSAVKYNRTSSNMTNANGISIYFPKKRVSAVDNMVDTYGKIGLDDSYSRCIRQFASIQSGGQFISGGTGSPLSSLFGELAGMGNSGGNAGTVSELLESFLGGNFGRMGDLDRSNTDFLDRELLESSVEYLAENQFDTNQLTWRENKSGEDVLLLTEEQWGLIQNLELNVFYDDGAGFIDLGLDNVFTFDEEGNLYGRYDHTWLAINGQPVAYYFLDETADQEVYTITGRVPAMLNGERVELILMFDSENPNGRIAGARTDYEGVTDTVAKGLIELQPGDKLDFLCDYYSYDGAFQDNYYLGETMTVTEEMEISNVDIGSGNALATYRLTDIYNQHYWTEVIGK